MRDYGLKPSALGLPTLFDSSADDKPAIPDTIRTFAILLSCKLEFPSSILEAAAYYASRVSNERLEVQEIRPIY
jgi:hypothetical protein